MPTSTHKSRPTDRFPLFHAAYKVLVVKNPEPEGDHDRALAICIEQNLVGRGRRVDSALQDLANTLVHALKVEWTEFVPHVQDNPDPAALVSHADKNVLTYEGGQIIARMKMVVDVWKVVKSKNQYQWDTPAVRYEPVAV